jgi:hypothetical protein
MATNPAMFSWQQPLAALFGGISAAGQPGGFANFGAGVNQTMQQQQQQQLEQERFDILRQQADQQRQEFEAGQRRANQQAEQQAATQRQIAAMFGGAGAGGAGSIGTASAPSAPQVGQPAMFSGQMPVTPHGGYGAATGGALQPAMFGRRQDGSVPSFSDVQNGGMAEPTQQGAQPDAGDELPFGFSPEQAQLFMTLPYEQQVQILTQRAFSKPTTPDLQTFFDGDQEYQGYVGDNGQIVRVTPNAPRWQRQQGAGLTERQRNAIAAGLQPGTPEYEQYILGRDDNEGGGPFEGNAMDAQASNILLTGDPASPEYAAAYAWLAQPKVTFDATTGKSVIVSPDLTWAKQPTNPGAAMPFPIAPNQSGGESGALPLMPSVTGSRAGPTVQNAQGIPQQQPAPSAPGTETMQVPGATITTNPGTGLSAADRSKLRNIRAEADSIKSALTRFKEVVQSSDWRSDLSAYGGGMTEGGRKLNSTYNSAALLTKAESLFNLGVLNGPDLELIRRTLPDPSTLPGLLTSEGASGVAVDEIINLIDNRLAAFESQFGGDTSAPPSGGAGGAPSGGKRVDQLPAGNWQ